MQPATTNTRLMHNFKQPCTKVCILPHYQGKMRVSFATVTPWTALSARLREHVRRGNDLRTAGTGANGNVDREESFAASRTNKRTCSNWDRLFWSLSRSMDSLMDDTSDDRRETINQPTLGTSLFFSSLSFFFFSSSFVRVAWERA